MRIIAGRHRGTQLATVGKGDADAHLRPTSDRVRENLFNMLDGGRFGSPISGARVLDLFAGTGALGFEALSRGAAFVSFVDDGAVAAKLIAQNAQKLDRNRDIKLHRINALKIGAGSPHDLVFADPPYGKGLGPKVLVAATTNGWLTQDALIVLEDRQPQIAPPGFAALDQRRYGDTWITILRHDGAEPGKV